ncbi:hypothetical protein RHGRI_024913 [Rhododendron griersonianum]|uniref:Auxin-responsive protein n=1 Tax=Rhododendron griersonianum TaxID=479676 RepID=A0AAV6JA59_9ERIC|nr:hypothetical protein RHGRI_024913 [Rhododendron griersonianum]
MAKEGLGLEITELRLGLPGANPSSAEKNEKKRAFSEISGEKEAVGWPPVCSYRRKNSFNIGAGAAETAKILYVKVSMDGAPFLRKIDLGNHKGYDDLALALEKLFQFYGIGEALKDQDNSEFFPIYEDKDGDWMLVGDVPWEMFTESCKRLRIKKRSEAKTDDLKNFLVGMDNN